MLLSILHVYVILSLCLILSSEAFISQPSLKSLRLHQQQDLSMAFDLGNILGGFGNSGLKPSGKPVCVITGTTSGLGRETARALLIDGKYEVVMGCRNVDKMQQVANEEGFNDLPGTYKILPLDLGSFDSTRQFVRLLKKNYPKPLDRLVCNAAVYQPANLQDQDEKGVGRPKFTVDGFEEQLQINHLSHFLLCSLLIDDMTKAAKQNKEGARMIVVGSITGNDNTVGGGLVKPIADLGELEGLEQGGKSPIAMIDGKAFDGAKAYKDSKVCNMMTINELHRRYHKSTGITFSTMYPGCIAETQLFREKRDWFRKLFPLFMKYVTGGYVGETEAGQRLAAVVDDPRCKTSGKYWSWNGGARTVAYIDPKTSKLSGAGGSGGELFENLPSTKVRDERKSGKMWDLSTRITGAKWPKANAIIDSGFVYEDMKATLNPKKTKDNMVNA